VLQQQFLELTLSTTLDWRVLGGLTPALRRHASRIIESLLEEGFKPPQANAVVCALFPPEGRVEASVAQTRAAFGVFAAADDPMAIPVATFRQQLPLLACDAKHMSYKELDDLFLSADAQGGGKLDLLAFRWVLSFLRKQVDPSQPLRTLDEIRFDAWLRIQQHSLESRVGRLRAKRAVAERVVQLLGFAKGKRASALACAQLLLRLHKGELEEAALLAAAAAKDKTNEESRRAPVTAAGVSIPRLNFSQLKVDQGGALAGAEAGAVGDATDQDGAVLLRGSHELLMRRAEVTLRALAAFSTVEQEQPYETCIMLTKQVLFSLEEELPVTAAAVDGIGRSRGLHARADAMHAAASYLKGGAIRKRAAARELLKTLRSQLRGELLAIDKTPDGLEYGDADVFDVLKHRLRQVEALCVSLSDNEQGGEPGDDPGGWHGGEQGGGDERGLALVSAACSECEQLMRLFRRDAARVLAFFTQGVVLHASPIWTQLFESAASALPAREFEPHWQRLKSLLVGAEKVLHSPHHIRHNLQTTFLITFPITFLITSSGAPGHWAAEGVTSEGGAGGGALARRHANSGYAYLVGDLS